MRSPSLIAIGFVALLVVSCASESLGHGYRLVRRSEVSRGFEGRSHFTDLNFRSQRLGTVGQYSISPSGRFVLFEDTGKLLLFDRQTRKNHEVTDGAFAIPRDFIWSETAGVVDIIYYEKHAPSRITLQR